MSERNTEDYLWISVLQHYAFCPRQCALIHVEQTFEDNIYTLRGHRVHERADSATSEVVDGVRVERSLSLCSHQYQWRGIADVVEFGEDDLPYPVEYKSGPRRHRLANSIQLCAQAMCLEEMFNCEIPMGAIFHHASRRRQEVELTAALRKQTLTFAEQARKMLEQYTIPAPVHDKRCEDCSLQGVCLPDLVGRAVFNPFIIGDETDS
ncbi:CRISPR-associated protein Cas4 [Spirulina subsalsa]|uniref:CRISPR-associated protein Cas4 n=1 Tax=Spirulina subsalsa TaxID=54311 RepID=UPI000317C0A1|nr:CRISPR-associated protein Cas4 [Spirulina subsalsa]